MTFTRFMELALYHPEHGYYSSGRCAMGRAGDYFTSVTVGPLFGRLLAAQFAEMWEMLGRPNEFTIVEQGAHGGEFARDVLQAARAQYSEFFHALRYCIVEPFLVLEARQVAALAEFKERVEWRKSLEDLTPFCGVHFSNELLDAMPVHLVKWTGAEWVERHVTQEEQGAFVLVALPLSGIALSDRLREVPMPLPAGYETEVHLAAPEWMAALASKVAAGFVVAVDYGFEREEYYAPHRSSGTVRGYSRHHLLPSPLTNIGHADITAHVEWTSLEERARSCGLTVAGFADQHHFITGLLAGEIGGEFNSTPEPKTQRALQTLLHPGLLGMKFQFLVLEKGVPQATKLSGLRFAKAR